MKDFPPSSPTRTDGKNRPLLLVLSCLAAAAVGVVSFLPHQDKAVLHTTGRLHSWGHLLAFGLITFIGVRGVRSSKARFAVVCCAMLLGALIEFGEHQVFHIPLEITDIVFDIAGVLLGALAAAPRSSVPHVSAPDTRNA